MINIRRVSDHYDTEIKVNGTTIDVGFLNKEERNVFLQELLSDVLYELDSDDRWFIDHIKDEIESAGYELVERD